MKVLLNSDIAYSQGLRSDLPKQLAALAEGCKERYFEIALPLTTVLEYERRQSAIANQERSALIDAADRLDRFGIGHAPIKVDELIKTRGLDELFMDTGVKVEVISPTIEDFHEAHRRASLHLSPQQPNDKGEDEMRDLVIWVVCIRIAKEQGGALLVSRDKIHTGDLGKEEARAAGLWVVPTVDDALRFFQIETPDAKLFLEMPTPVGKALPSQGLAVPVDIAVSEVRNARFVRHANRRTSALATV